MLTPACATTFASERGKHVVLLSPIGSWLPQPKTALYHTSSSSSAYLRLQVSGANCSLISSCMEWHAVRSQQANGCVLARRGNTPVIVRS